MDSRLSWRRRLGRKRLGLGGRGSARAEEARLRRVRRVDNRRMKYLRRVFGALGGDEGEVEARCLMAL
jgi:hypothetical protein